MMWRIIMQFEEDVTIDVSVLVRIRQFSSWIAMNAIFL